MIVDIHAYWDRLRMSLTDQRAEMKKHGIDQAVLSPPCTEGTEPDKSPLMYAVQRKLLRSPAFRPAAEAVQRSFYDREGRLRPLWRLFTRKGKPINKVLVPDNAGLLEAIAGAPELKAWHWINPLRPPPPAETRAALKNPRVAGIKLHAYWHGFRAGAARPAFRLAAQTGRPVYLILGFGWLDDICELLAEFPQVAVIFGYAGFPYFDPVWDIVPRFAKAYVDLASFHVDERGIADAVALAEPERCLYGTDCPYNFPGPDGRFDYSLTLERVRRLGLGDAEKAMIFGGNAERVLAGRTNG